MKKYLITQNQYISVLNNIILEQDSYSPGTQFGNIVYDPNSIRVTNQPNVVVVKDTVTQKDYALIINTKGIPVDWFRGDPSTLKIGKNKTEVEQIKQQACNGRGFPSVWFLINKIIAQLEGHYYHPNMIKNTNGVYTFIGDNRYGNSGETFLGIDRKNWGTESPDVFQKFWGLIDNDKEKKKNMGNKKYWKKWNYGLEDDPQLLKTLKEFATQLIRNRVELYGQQYLTQKAKNVVTCDVNLLLHFIYAAYNGPKYFNEMANIVNRTISNGGNVNQCLSDLNSYRVNYSNSLIRQTGEKILSIIKSGVLNNVPTVAYAAFKLQ